MILRLRENIFHSIEQTTNDLKVQIDATNFEFRKRMYEMKRAKEELEYQLRKVKRLPLILIDIYDINTFRQKAGIG